MVQTHHQGRIQKGIVRTINRGWFTIQLDDVHEHKYEMIHQTQQNHTTKDYQHQTFQGPLINKRLKDIITFFGSPLPSTSSSSSPLPSPVLTTISTNNTTEHPSFIHEFNHDGDVPNSTQNHTEHDAMMLTRNKNESIIVSASIPTSSSATSHSPIIHNLDPLIFQLSHNNKLDTKDNDDDYLQQCTYFASFRKWIVFSDLHCSTATLPTCLQILHILYERAKERKAGIVFLGDFWHHRNNLRIDCLNAILQSLHTIYHRQDVPMIMIPGNHDQVTLQGYEHGLTPLQNAFFIQQDPQKQIQTSTSSETTATTASTTLLPGILIFTYPTIFKKALFIPHIRDVTTLQSILRSIHPQLQQHQLHHDQQLENISSSDLASTTITNNDSSSTTSSFPMTTVDSILCHADITGAFMNDNMISTGGISPSYFPPNIPIYSGHFHKPHVVNNKSKNISIRYVGSPYQVSLSEAGEIKSLLVLDSDQGWKCVEEIPLDVGKKHYKCSTVDEFLTLSLMTISTATNTTNTAAISSSLDHNTHVGQEKGTEFIHIKPGDRVIVTIQPEEMEDMKRMHKTAILKDDKKCIGDETSAKEVEEKFTHDGSKLQIFEETIKSLRNMGISVEVKEVKLLPNYPMVNLASIKDPFQENNTVLQSDKTSELSWFSLDDLSPMATLSSFLYHEVERGAIKNQTATKLHDAGKSLLEYIIENTEDDSSSQTPSFHRGTTHLCLESVTIQGFGPFKDSVTYPLINRGLVLLRGSSMDVGGPFESNGSGKTTLAMSALWILTGSVDSRPLEDSKVGDVVNDFSKVAKGTLRGTINGSSFIISRSKSSAKGSLTFSINEKDLTRQSIKETQNVINETLGVGPQTLSRTIFHGQHTMNGLLEAADTKFKDELSLIAPTEIWQEATSIARSRSRQLSTQATELDGKISVKKEDMNILKDKSASAMAQLVTQKEEFDSKRLEIEQKLKTLKSASNEPVDLSRKFSENEEQLKSFSEQIISLENQIQEKLGNKETELNDFRKDLILRFRRVEDTRAKIALMRRELDRTEYRLECVRQKYSDLKSIDIESPSYCPTCKQSIQDEQSHVHLEQELNACIDSLDNLEKMYTTEKIELDGLEASLSVILSEVDFLQSTLQEREEYWRTSLIIASRKLSEARFTYASLNEEKSSILQHMNRDVEIQAQEKISHTEIKRYQEMLKSALVRYEILQEDLKKMMEMISDFEQLRTSLLTDAETMSSLVDALGSRGIQSFILQNAVYSLENISQAYLDELSGGTLRLHLNFDSSERINRSAEILGTDGQWLPRPMSSLSGGQWRRCSLALSLGFSDLVSRRGRLRSSLLVFDEPLTHLDSSGRASVGQLLRKILASTGFGSLATTTIIIILQDLAAEELEESFDSIDEVTRMSGSSIVKVDQK